jgi:hypothetical protein
VIELSRVFVLTLYITDLFKERQCGIDHAGAGAVEPTGALLDCLDELIAMTRLAFQKHATGGPLGDPNASRDPFQYAEYGFSIVPE